jgi:hypothetical protein
VSGPEQERIKAARDEARRKERERAEREGNANGERPDRKPDPNPNPQLKKEYRTGIPIPGKEGFVFNPFTNNPVDVRAIPPGTLVRDPQDSDPDHKFRVP